MVPGPGRVRFYGLSGTPMVNSAADLWPLAFGPLRLNIDWWDWCLRFTEIRQGFDGPTPTGILNAGDLAEILRPFLLRRTLSGIGIELPSLDYQSYAQAIPSTAMASIMAGLENWTPVRLAAALNLNDDLHDSAIARVRKVLGIAKAPGIAAHVHNLLVDNAGPLVVFFQHTDVRKYLFETLRTAGHSVSWIDGTISRSQLGAAEEWFQAGQLDVLLVQTDAGGMGITLHRAHRCVIAEMPWTSVSLQQAVKRIHRIGQTRPCQADIVRAEGCWLDDVLASVVSRKHRATEQLFSLLESR